MCLTADRVFGGDVHVEADDIPRTVDAICESRGGTGHIDGRERPPGIQEPMEPGRISEEPDDSPIVINGRRARQCGAGNVNGCKRELRVRLVRQRADR